MGNFLGGSTLYYKSKYESYVIQGIRMFLGKMEGDVAITIWRNEADLGVKVVEEENKYVEEIISMENKDH